MKLLTINISNLKPHPKNPRLILRDDVIDGIVAGLKNGFKEKHAIHVRPVADYYEILSGHHRLKAAEKAGIDEVPCWVEQLDDDEAYMELVKANNQGELTALEIGIHALSTVHDKTKKGGGIRAYAAEIGKCEVRLKEWIGAAKVYSVLCTISYTNAIQEKPSHLYEISKAPQQSWQSLVNSLIDAEWSVKETQAAVDRVKSFELLEWMTLDTDDLYKSVALNPSYAKQVKQAITAINAYLAKLDIVTLFKPVRTDEVEIIDGREFYKVSPESFQFDSKADFLTRLQNSEMIFDVKFINGLYKTIIEHCTQYSDQSTRYQPVLTDTEQADLDARRDEMALIARKEALMPELMQGDVLEQLRQLKNESINLVCIDPPYNMDKADWDSYGSGVEFADWCESWLTECYRVLKSDGAIYVFGINRMLGHIQHRMDKIGFHYRNWITWDTIQGAGGGLWVNRHEDILYFSKSKNTFENSDSVKLERSEENVREYKGREYNFKNPSNVWRFPCVDSQHIDRTEHPTQKPVELIDRIIKASCPDDGVVLDCFMGSGTTGVAAMQNQRKCIGIELNKNYIQLAESRFTEIEVV